MRRMGDVWKTTTNRSSRNAQLTPASPKQCLTADTAILINTIEMSMVPTLLHVPRTPKNISRGSVSIAALQLALMIHLLEGRCTRGDSRARALEAAESLRQLSYVKPSLLNEAPDASEGPLACAVGWQCHSALTPKSISWLTRFTI
ncbi:unnamed protein product [Trichogramma brassicae]|uniref:Uncharacterized protein n=1 Tax=Trichogramma brassicae TaxID=86971 RepID=A0A6H5IKI2_9HYME|nr:unnamed protein product [Trichogramma brassicae]